MATSPVGGLALLARKVAAGLCFRDVVAARRGEVLALTTSEFNSFRDGIFDDADDVDEGLFSVKRYGDVVKLRR